MELTASQQRILDEVRRDGERVYNGRAQRPVKALEAAGLVNVDWDMRPQVKGNGMELVQRLTVTPKKSERYAPYSNHGEVDHRLMICRDCSTRSTVVTIPSDEISEHDTWHAEEEE